LGDSEFILEDIISKINEPITFWLDGHFSGWDTVQGERNSPLMQELEIIKNHKIKTHTILIDDLRAWVKPVVDFDVNDITIKLKEINPSYIISYEDGHVDNDVMVVHIKK